MGTKPVASDMAAGDPDRHPIGQIGQDRDPAPVASGQEMNAFHLADMRQRVGGERHITLPYMRDPRAFKFRQTPD